jgi:hypothetical protein
MRMRTTFYIEDTLSPRQLPGGEVAADEPLIDDSATTSGSFREADDMAPSSSTPLRQTRVEGSATLSSSRAAAKENPPFGRRKSSPELRKRRRRRVVAYATPPLVFDSLPGKFETSRV